MDKQVKLTEYTKPQNRSELLKIQKENAYKSFWHKFIVFSFFVIIFGMLALRLALPAPTESIAENRVLKEMPDISLNNIFFGKFTTEFEDYFADTFPLRDPLMNAGEYVSYLHKIPIRGVDSIVIAEDNMMQGEDEVLVDEDPGGPEGGEAEGEDQPYETAPSPTETAVTNPFTGETPTPTPQVQEQNGTFLLTDNAIYKITILDPKAYGNWAKGINKLAKALPGKRVFAMSPPNSFAFYADSKYIKPENDQKAGIEDIYSKMAPGVYAVDTYPYLDSHKGEYIFFRTDHHWTALGAYYGYIAFCETAGLEPGPLSAMQKKTYEREYLGPYYNQLKDTAKAKLIKQYPDHIDYYIPPAQCQVTRYIKVPLKEGIDIPMFCLDFPEDEPNYYNRIFLGGDSPCIRITTDTKNGRSIVLLKDSFANAFTPFLTANYENIYLVDFRRYNIKGKPDFDLEQFVKKNKIDDVLLIMNIFYTNNPGYVNLYLKALP